jgi:hypothetical protein
MPTYNTVSFLLLSWNRYSHDSIDSMNSGGYIAILQVYEVVVFALNAAIRPVMAEYAPSAARAIAPKK